MAVAQIGALNSFSAGTTIVAADMNDNFTDVKTAFNNLVSGANTINVDTINEVTGAGGVTIDGVLLKDSTVTGTIATAAQPNITSLGTLTSLTVTTLVLTGGTVTGQPTWSSSQAITLSTGIQANITQVGTLTVLNVSGVATFLHATGVTTNTVTERSAGSGVTLDGVLLKDGGATFTAGVSGITTLEANSLAGEISTAAQPNITSVGTLTSLTVSGALNATLSTAAQPNVTSLGTLTVLNVDNLRLNGNTLSATSGAINITPAAGSAIVLDGTINVDAGVVTGATSITSTAFVGTLSTAAQPNITSVGTLTSLTMGGNINMGTYSVIGPNNGYWMYLTADTDCGIFHSVGTTMELHAAGSACFSWADDGGNEALGFFGAAPTVKPTVSGSRGGNAALADLLTELATLGLITNSTSA